MQNTRRIRYCETNIMTYVMQMIMLSCGIIQTLPWLKIQMQTQMQIHSPRIIMLICSKGGVYIQTFGWMGTRYLCRGSEMNTQYITKRTILDKRVEFARDDLVGGNCLPFLNMMDKGYRITLECKDNEGQRIIRPKFSKLDRKFTAIELLP